MPKDTTTSPALLRIKRRNHSSRPPKESDENHHPEQDSDDVPVISVRKHSKHALAKGRDRKRPVLKENVRACDPILEKYPELMKKGLHRLAYQIEKYQDKVQALTDSFEELREALEDAECRFEALETNHGLALDALEEEKETSRKYYGYMRNADVEIQHLRMALPDDYTGPAVGGWSQAKI